MTAKKGVHSLNYLVKTKHTGLSFFDWYLFYANALYRCTHGWNMYKRCSNAAFAAGICIKDALLYLQQNNDFRINAACTSRFLGRKSIIITVSWCTTMQECSRMTKNRQIVRKNLQKKKDRHPWRVSVLFKKRGLWIWLLLHYLYR